MPSVFHLSDFKHFLVIVSLFIRWDSLTENYLEEMGGEAAVEWEPVL